MSGKAPNARYLESVIPAPSAPPGGFGARVPEMRGPCPWHRGAVSPDPAAGPGLPGTCSPLRLRTKAPACSEKHSSCRGRGTGSRDAIPPRCRVSTGQGSGVAARGFSPKQTPAKHDKPPARPGHFVTIGVTGAVNTSTAFKLHLTWFCAFQILAVKVGPEREGRKELLGVKPAAQGHRGAFAGDPRVSEPSRCRLRTHSSADPGNTGVPVLLSAGVRAPSELTCMRIAQPLRDRDVRGQGLHRIGLVRCERRNRPPRWSTDPATVTSTRAGEKRDTQWQWGHRIIESQTL